MLTADRVKTISKLAFPIAIALSSALVMSLIDLAMVGRLGNHAIAAVGLSVFSNTLILAFVSGLGPAVQGLVARRRGEGSGEPRCLPLNGGLLIALAVGLPLTIICYLLTPYFFSMISSDPEITRIGIPFLRTLYIAIIAEGMHAAFQGHWAGVERPKVYLSIILFMGCLNVFLNYIFIFGHFGAPALGATGAAIGTVFSLFAGIIINCAICFFRFRKDGFLKARPNGDLLVRIIKLGVPATFQEFFFSASYLVFLWLVGQVGTVELAAANVLVRMSLVLLILATSLGMASATLVSKTVGEGDLTGAAQWGWDSAKLGVIGITLLGLPLVLFPRLFLSIFLSDPHAISIAVIPMQLVGATAGVGSLIWVFAYTLFSVGDGNRVLMVSFIMQWIFFLPLVWVVGPHLHYGLLPIWIVNMAYGAIATVVITAIWADGRWKKIRI
ncbi:MAG TPA: MATE family efflux transporter [Candidatus Angelobacter sp.]|nr:MATE family efflux transporter [Candidatus Angelobacter sp.]